jgi:DNA-binding transcriptional LysR family regulator
MSVQIAMARRGLGIAQIPCLLADPDPLLHRIPAKFVESGWGLWVLSHVDLRTTARVSIFRDFLVEELNKQRDLIEGHSV